MAKFLAFKRSTRQVVTVDTINAKVADLGGQLATADTTNAFPNRSENVVAVFRGDPYALYRSASNEVKLARYSGGAWADVVGFTALTSGTGLITPTGLHVVQNRLVAIATLSLSAGVDAVYARRSAADDGTTWDAAVTQAFATQPLDTRAGPSIVWHNTVWFTTAEGIGYYVPATDTLSATFDQGDTPANLIAGQRANFGSFAIFASNLYYVLATDNPVGAPAIFELDSSWDPAAPTPTFTNLNIVIPGVGNVTLSNDTGNYSLFVNKAGILSLIYSGSNESKLVTISRAATSWTVDDVTDTLLPSSISGEADLGFGYYVDDRRSSNEKHVIIVRFRPAVPVAILLASWDGVTAVTQTATLDDGGSGLDLILPDAERSDFRTFTDNQPAAYIDTYSQPFPGRIRIDYTVQDSSSRPIDILAEYSIDGQSWSTMTQGDGDSGNESLPSAPTGVAYFFNWDAFADLDGTYDNMDIRIVARLAGA